MSRGEQLELALERVKAGKKSRRSAQARGRNRSRKPVGRRASPERKGFVVHKARPSHHRRHPVHVTMRRVRLGPSFRAQLIYDTILAELREAKHRGVRVVYYSIQDNHLHLMVEGQDSSDLSKQMCLLFSRVAMAVNAIARRHGALFRDRHQRVELSSPTQVRNALVYILFNHRKHANAGALMSGDVKYTLDAFSSAAWFEGWAPNARPPPELIALARSHSPPDTASRPRTWLAQQGWMQGLIAGGRKGGPIRFDELPQHAN